MKNILKILLVYFSVFIIFTIFYTFLFHTKLFFSQKILFYRGLILLFISLITFLFFSFFVFKKIKISYETLFSAVIVAFSINLNLFIIFPVTFERSITMYLLRTLSKNSNNICQGLSKSEIEEKLVKQYIIFNKAIEKRVNEQRTIGFIKEKNQCLQLTSKGLKFIKFSKILEKLYGLK